ncbi:MAG: thioredoxin-disulfide reductase [Bacteroidales bacterium]|nr:thioredoxin-disulfide reductase [Bacteroidales bacterium]
MVEKRKCVIIGSGPAGLTAAIYAARAGLEPLVYEGIEPGGQLTTTTEVENFPGYPDGVTGPVLMEDIKKQALRFGTEIRYGSIEQVNFLSKPFVLIDDEGRKIEALTVIIATGASAKWLGIPGEKEYSGFGVSACATCDGYFYRGKTVAVVGGGDTAAEEATYLAKLAHKVYLIHRRDQLRASKAMQQKVFNTPNIEIIWNAIPKEIVGETRGFAKAVSGIIITDKNTNEEKTIPVDGVFIAIGHKPNTDIFKGQLELDEQGYIITQGKSTRTSIPGVFAAGDVQDPIYRQAVTAAGSGCMAALDAERYLTMSE